MGGVRMETLHDLAPVLFAFLACGGFAVIYNIHGPGILICAFGGALGWLSYLLSAPILQSDISQTLVAAIVISAYSECMARVRKCPVTGYLLVAIFPLVPGGGIYYAMSYCVAGDTGRFLDTLLHTFGMAAALAVGAMLTSSLFRAAYLHLNHRKSAG